MRLQPYSGAQSSSYSSSSSYSVSTLLTKPCTFELRMLYYNTLLLHKIDKIKMAGISREISSAMDENHSISSQDNIPTLKNRQNPIEPCQNMNFYLGVNGVVNSFCKSDLPQVLFDPKKGSKCIQKLCDYRVLHGLEPGYTRP